MPGTVKYTGRTVRMKVKKTDKYGRLLRPRRKKRVPYVKLKRRLGGYAKMPYFRYARCYDGTPLELKVDSAVESGFWTDDITLDFNTVPGASVFKEIYRFFRLRKVIVQYTPCTSSNEFSKLFAHTNAAGEQALYNAGGGVLEMKHLKHLGYETTPVNWASVLNRAGKLRRCGSTKPFRYTVYPTIQQIVQDTVGTDPTSVRSAPWLSTEVTTNLTLDHYLSIDAWHAMNNVSYDNSNPLVINQRFTVLIEFKGLKI